MLPAPNLDDRTFQGLVDEAKRLVQTRCPEWTDHNVSDPGRHADRGVRADGRPADLPAEPRPRPELRQVPRADRRRAPAARGRDRAGDVLAVRAAAAAGAGARRDPGGHAAHRHPRPGRLLDPARAEHRALHVHPRRDRARRRRAGRPHGGAVGRPGLRGVLAHPDAGRRAPDRPEQRGAVVRGHPADGVHRGRCRRRPAASAAGLGGLDRHRLDGRARSTTTTPAA